MNEIKHLTTYKVFDQKLKCKDFQFNIGETYTHEGKLQVCLSGFHSCKYPLNILEFYPPGTSRFATVKASGDIEYDSDSSKLASSAITINGEIGLPELIEHSIEYVMKNLCGFVPRDHDSRYGSISVNSSEYSISSNTGYFSITKYPVNIL